MFRFTKLMLIAALAFGFLVTLDLGQADAGYFYGNGCFRPSYNSCATTYVTRHYSPSYSYCSPTIYRSWNYGDYCGSYGYSGYRYSTPYTTYRSCYTPAYVGVTNYGFTSKCGYGYGGYGGCYAVPTSYGQLCW